MRRWAKAGRRDRGVLHAVETVHGLAFRRADVEAFADVRPVRPDAQSTLGRLDDAIAAVVAEAPVLTDDQRVKLALVLAGSAPAEGVR